MSRRYRYTTSLNRGGDEPTWEGEVTVSFIVEPNEAESPPIVPNAPGSYPTVEDIRLEEVDGKPRPWGMYSGYIADEDNVFEREVVEELEGSDRHIADMLAEAGETDAADADHAADLRREDH